VGCSKNYGNAGSAGDGLSTNTGTVVARLHEAEDSMMRKSKEFVHEGKYAAEVAVDLIEDDTAWSPYLSPDDARKLDAVRSALRRGDIAEAAKHGRVFELTPVVAK
jgi:hypothetical protein